MPDTGILWIVYDANRSGPGREFNCRQAAQKYRARRAAETGGRWVIRFRGAGPAIEARDA